jgi:argininosuccinate lyase
MSTVSNAPNLNAQTLWAKDLPLDAQLHAFTVGRDPELDLALYSFDCIASAAHVRMLNVVSLLCDLDCAALLGALKVQYQLSEAGQIKILPGEEDCHTALELALVAATGEAGKRVHLARSRNDQVLVALRLYLRQQQLKISAAVSALARTLLSFAQAHEHAALPGFTHMRRAMPSSFGQWAAGFAEGLNEELDAAVGLQARINRCPLGAAAGFGVPLPIDRDFSAKLRLHELARPT